MTRSVVIVLPRTRLSGSAMRWQCSAVSRGAQDRSPVWTLFPGDLAKAKECSMAWRIAGLWPVRARGLTAGAFFDERFRVPRDPVCTATVCESGTLPCRVAAMALPETSQHARFL
jgi:hypothetical protein